MASKNQKKYLDKNPNLIRHYGLRKLSVGVASVVLGTTAVLGAAQTAKADTADNGQSPAEASQTASSTPDPASDGNQGNSYNNNTNSFVPNTLPQGESESDYVSQYADQMTQQNQPEANNENTGNQTQAAPVSSQNGQSDPSEQTQEFQINNNEQSQLQTQQEADALRTSLAADPDPSGSGSGSQNQGQEISNSDYQILSHRVLQIKGATPSDRSYVDAHVVFQFQNLSKIKNGDYIDVHLGVQMSDGTEENYSNGTSATIPITVDGIQIGQVVPELESDHFTSFYRLIFNQNVARFKNLNLAIDFNWYNVYGTDPISMQLHTNNRSVTIYTPTNDLRIGTQVFSSGLALPVEYLTGNKTQPQHPNVTMMTLEYPVHNWISNGQIVSTQINDGIFLCLADNMSHDFTVTVAAVNNNLFSTEWASDSEIASQIKDALRNYNSYRVTAAHATDNPDVGTFTRVTNTTPVPAVTVTDDPATTATDTNYQVKTFHIRIAGSDPLNFGNAHINFANVISKPGIDTAPASTTTTYDQDKKTASHNRTTYLGNTAKALSLINSGNTAAGDALLLTTPEGKLVTADGFVFGKGYDGPDLRNQALQTFMYDHAAGWAKVHDNIANRNYYFGGVDREGEASSPFGASVQQSEQTPDTSGQNEVNGNGTPASDNYSQDIIYQTADGTRVKTATGALTGTLTNGQATVTAADANSIIDNNLPDGYRYVAGHLTVPETITSQTPAAIVVTVEKSQTPSAQKYNFSIVYKLADGTIIQTVPNVLTGNYPTTIPADRINNLINTNLPHGYQYVSGRLTQPEAITNADPSVTVIVARENAQNYSQDIVYKTNDGTIVATAKGALTGTLTNGQATVTAANANSIIDNNMPDGYKYVSGHLTANETITSQTPAAIVVTVEKNQNPSAKTYNLSIVYKLADGTIIQTVPNLLTGNYPTTIPADRINNLIDTNLPKGYKYVSGRLTQPEAVTNADPSINVIVARENANEFSQDIIYQTNDGTIIKTVPNAFTGTLTNGQATVSATTINSAIDTDMPSGYEYISGKVPADEIVQSQTPKAITVIVRKQTNPQAQTFSQNIVYETTSGMLVKTVPNAITGTLTNGQAVASANSVNSQIDANMPAGYTYVSGKLTSDELITSATPADITVIVQATGGNGNGNNGNNTGGNGNGNNGNNTGGNGSNPNNNGGNGSNPNNNGGNGNNGNNTGGNGSNPNSNGGNGNSGNNAGGNGNGNNVTPINPFIPTNNGANGSNTGSNGFNGYSGTGYNGYYNGGYARRGYGYGSYSQAVPTGFTRGGRSSAAGLNTQQAGFRTRLPQTGTNDNSELMAMALGLGALLLSGGLAGADKHRYNN